MELLFNEIIAKDLSRSHFDAFVIESIMNAVCSVTRFGEISPFWQKIQVFDGFFIFGKIANLLWQIYYITGLVFIVANGHIIKHNLTIWSHWQYDTRCWKSRL